MTQGSDPIYSAASVAWFVDALLQIVEHGDPQAAADATSDMIAGCSGLQMAFIGGDGTFQQLACGKVDPVTTLRLGTEFSTPDRNPVIAAMPNLAPDRFVEVEQMVDVPRYLDTEFYQELMEPRGWMRVAMLSMQGDLGALSVGIEQDPNASFAVARQGEPLIAHLYRALEARVAANAPSQSAFLLEPSGHPVSGAASLGQLSLGTLRCSGPMGVASPRDRTMIDEFAACLERASRGHSSALLLQGDHGMCRVALEPGPFRGVWPVVWANVTRLSAPEWTLASLRSAYGLTPREASVVLGLLSGGGIDDVARDLGLTPRSVRTYLSTIFAKTETSGQVQLILRLIGA